MSDDVWPFNGMPGFLLVVKGTVVVTTMAMPLSMVQKLPPGKIVLERNNLTPGLGQFTTDGAEVIILCRLGRV